MAGGDIFGTGVSALLAFQSSLATTGHNVANVNTEGYSRQRVELGQKNPQFAGYGYVGRGVDVTDVRRIHSEVITQEIRNTTATASQMDTLSLMAGQLDNLVADADAGISPALQSFFDAVNDVADDPASIPARQVMISQAEALVDRFDHFEERFDVLDRNVNDTLDTSVAEINTLTSAIADLNRNIVAAKGAGGGAQPNDLLDQRDQLLVKLAEHVAVTAVEEDDGAINVFVGKGQLLVNRFSTQTMSYTRNEFDPTRYEVALTSLGNTVEVSNLVSGGKLGGALQFRDEVLDPARAALGRIAFGLSMDFNDQHSLGLDLQGDMGGDFFRVPTSAVAHSDGNAGSADIALTVVDASELTLSDYRLTYNGANVYTLVRSSDGQSTSLTIPAGSTTATVDGFQITVNTAAIAGDTFQLLPTQRGADTIDIILDDVTRIAAAAPVRGITSLANTGEGVLTAPSVIDATTYVPDTYTIAFGDSAITAVPAAGTGQPTDVTDGGVLEYELIINGYSVYTQDDGTGELTLDQLAAQINADVAQTGVRAYVDNTSNSLFLANEPGTSLPITVEERLNATTPDALEAGDQVTGYFGSVLVAAGPGSSISNSITFTAAADSYVVVDSGGTAVTSGAYTSGANIDFNGIRTAVTGNANLGDLFTIEENTSGVGDNRNALALAALRATGSLDSGTSTYQEAYSQMVAQVGSTANQADINLNAQNALLRTAKATREAISGVNLDEEAANMMRFQQAYQAAARIISVSSSLFDSLLAAVNR